MMSPSYRNKTSLAEEEKERFSSVWQRASQLIIIMVVSCVFFLHPIYCSNLFCTPALLPKTRQNATKENQNSVIN